MTIAPSSKLHLLGPLLLFAVQLGLGCSLLVNPPPEATRRDGRPDHLADASRADASHADASHADATSRAEQVIPTDARLDRPALDVIAADLVSTPDSPPPKLDKITDKPKPDAAPKPSVVTLKGAPGGCTSSACYYISAKTANFTSNVTCSADTQSGNSGFMTWTQGPNATKQSPNYFGYPGQWVKVTCIDGQSHSASDTITW
jgi:hypothetical protein